MTLKQHYAREQCSSLNQLSGFEMFSFFLPDTSLHFQSVGGDNLWLFYLKNQYTVLCVPVDIAELSTTAQPGHFILFYLFAQAQEE